MISVLALVLSFGGPLPSGWHDLGRSAPEPSGMSGPEFAGGALSHYCVDESGRYVYDYALEGVDTITGKRRSVKTYYGHSPAGLSLWLLWADQPSPEKWGEIGTEKVFYVYGDVFGASSTSSTVHHLDVYPFVSRVGGPPVRIVDAEHTIRHAGLSTIVGPPPGSPSRRRVYVAHGSKTVEVVLPRGLDYVRDVFNGVDWDGRRIYAYGNGPRIFGPLEIRFSERRTMVLRLPLAKEYGFTTGRVPAKEVGKSWQADIEGTTVLSDRTICL
ncbi:MAG: hypothetical protein ACHQ50_14405, partial [Fimbriimonadales bacterium]